MVLVLAIMAASCDRDHDTSLSLGGGDAFPSPPPAKMPLVLSFWSITMMSERWRTNVACRRRIKSANNAITPISFLLCCAKDRGGIATIENKQTRGAGGWGKQREGGAIVALTVAASRGQWICSLPWALTLPEIIFCWRTQLRIRCDFVTRVRRPQITQKKRRHHFFQMVSSAICFGSFLILFSTHQIHIFCIFLPAQIFPLR